MATYKDKVVKSVTHYQPSTLPINQDDADGTNWNPGSGEGIYFYKESTSAWVQL